MSSLKQLPVIAFCLWHSAAIALYLLPTITIPLIGPVIGEAKAVTKPYVLSLSQWQSWDIFSPDPLRRSSVYRIEQNNHGKWTPVKSISYDSIGPLQRAKEIKILERLEDNWQRLIPSYLRQMCTEIRQSEGSALRLVARSQILPRTLNQVQKLSQTNLPKTEKVLGSTLCIHQQNKSSSALRRRDGAALTSRPPLRRSGEEGAQAPEKFGPLLPHIDGEGVGG